MHKVRRRIGGLKFADGGDLLTLGKYDGGDFSSLDPLWGNRTFSGDDLAGVANWSSFEAIPIARTIQDPSSEIVQVGSKLSTITRYRQFATDYQIVRSRERYLSHTNPTYSSSNTSIATVNNKGLVTHISDGEVRITITVGLEVHRLDLTLTTLGSSSTTTNSFVHGSLGRHCSDAIDLRIAGKNKATHGNIFSTQDHLASIYVRNPNCWAYGLDLTSISPFNSQVHNRVGGTLITPRHFVFAVHFEILPGNTIRFVTQNNEIVERTVTHTIYHPSYTPYFPDIAIGVLDNDVPSSITFAKVLPSDWERYISPDVKDIPVLALDQEEKALVTELYTMETSVVMTYPTKLERLTFFESLIDGDSGNPCFLIINGELVILTVWTFGLAGAGTSIAYHQTDMNSMIETLDSSAGINTGYTVSPIDLSRFNIYN